MILPMDAPARSDKYFNCAAHLWHAVPIADLGDLLARFGPPFDDPELFGECVGLCAEGGRGYIIADPAALFDGEKPREDRLWLIARAICDPDIAYIDRELFETLTELQESFDYYVPDAAEFEKYEYGGYYDKTPSTEALRRELDADRCVTDPAECFDEILDSFIMADSGMDDAVYALEVRGSEADENMMRLLVEVRADLRTGKYRGHTYRETHPPRNG